MNRRAIDVYNIYKKENGKEKIIVSFYNFLKYTKMEGRFKLIMVLFIAISCLLIHCDALVIPREISKRGIPEPEDVLATSRIGLKSVFIAAQHMVDNESALIEKKNPAPGSSSSSVSKPASSAEFGTSTADLVPATAKNNDANVKK